MTLVRFNPYREINSLERQLNRLFNDAWLPTNWQDLDKFTRTPAAELTEDKEAVYLNLEVPGMEAKDLDIQVTSDSVSISGERKDESSDDKHSEFRYGKFYRAISLPARVKNTEVTAEYKNGILHLTLPKAEAEKNKVVKVDVQVQ